jgi:hypothetical protein
MVSAVSGKESCQRGQDRPIGPGRSGSGDLAAENRELMAQHEDLYVLGGL